MKSRVLLIPVLLAAAGFTQASPPDAQAQAAALLRGVPIARDASPSAQVTSSPARPALDAQAQAAKLLSASRETRVDNGASASASAEQLGDHPAVIVARTWHARDIDPNTFVVAHPARLELLAASPSEKERTDDQATASTNASAATAAAGR